MWHVWGADGGMVCLALLSQPFAAKWVWVLTRHAWGMAANPTWPVALPHELGHNYVVDVLQSVLAGPRSPGTEPSAENSKPPGGNPERFEESGNSLPPPHTPTPHTLCLPWESAAHTVQHHTTPADSSSHPFPVLFIT